MNDSDRKPTPKSGSGLSTSRERHTANRAQSRVSFVLGVITLMLIFGYFAQSFIHIHNQEVLVVAIERIKERAETPED